MSEAGFKFFPADWLGRTRCLEAVEAGVFVHILAQAAVAGNDTFEMPERFFLMCGFRSRKVFLRTLAFLQKQGLIVVTGSAVTVPLLAEWRAMAGREPIPAAIRRAVIERDGNVCRYCGDTGGPFHIDHVHPVALGGTNDLDNLVRACAACNLSKSDRTVEEWMQ